MRIAKDLLDWTSATTLHLQGGHEPRSAAGLSLACSLPRCAFFAFFGTTEITVLAEFAFRETLAWQVRKRRIFGRSERGGSKNGSSGRAASPPANIGDWSSAA